MANEIESPNFVQAWLKDLTEEVNDRWYRIIPIWFAIFFACGGIVSYFLPEAFWSQERDTATIVYTGILTFNGILLALSWSAFAKIYEMVGAGRFAAFLREHDHLDSYLFAVRYVHASQMTATVFSMTALVLVQLPELHVNWQRVMCAIVLGMSGYAIKEASLAVGIMQDLIRYKAIFDVESRNNIHRAA